MHDPIVMLIVGIGLFAVAIIAYALRGRRTGSHPHCRKCGFDLFGKPEDSLRCSECGADLTRKRAVRKGWRVRRRKLLIAGNLLLALCIGIGGYRAWKWSRTTEWIQNEPVWLLVYEAHSPHITRRDAALAELTRRISVDTLPHDRELALVDEAMALQADTNGPWIPAWGTLVEAVHDAGRLPNNRWGEYLFAGYQPHLAPRSPVFRPCDELQFELLHDNDRVGPTIDPSDWFDVAIYSPQGQRLVIAGREVEGSQFDRSPTDHDIPPSRAHMDGLSHDPGIGLAAGIPAVRNAHAHSPWPPGLSDRTAQPISVQATLLVVPNWKEDLKLGSPAPPSPRSLQLSCNFKAAPSPLLIDDPSLAAAVERAVKVTGVTFNRCKIYKDVCWYLEADFDIAASPADLGYKVVFRWPSAYELYVQPTFFARAGQNRVISCKTGRGYVFDDPDNYDTSNIEVELIPLLSATPVGTRAIWGKPLIFKNVEVKHGKSDGDACP